MTIHEIAEQMRRRGVGERVIARVVRLNPHPNPAQRLRGIRYAPTAKAELYLRDYVSKGTFIRSHGRDNWRRIHPDYIHKDGKRAYITRAAFLDNVWLERRA